MNGTTIMRTTSGVTLVKNFSRPTSTKAAMSEAMTWPWYPVPRKE